MKNDYSRNLMYVYRFASIVNGVVGFLLLPVGIITKNTVGLACSIVENIPIIGGVFMTSVLFVISVAWTFLMLPIIAFSFLSKIPIVGIFISIFGIPFAVAGNIFLSVVPSWAILFDTNDPDAHSYWGKYILCITYPFSISFYKTNKIGDRTDECVKDVTLSLLNQYPLGKFLNSWIDQTNF